jgi:putative selenium metabolism protein SsnA
MRGCSGLSRESEEEAAVILLRNCTLVHLHPAEVRAGVDIIIEEAGIAEVRDHAPGRGPAGPGSRQIDLSGRIVMPGLVCSHTHFYSGLSRGIMARIQPSTDFVSHLAHLWWRLDRAIDREILRASGLVCAVEAIRAGCTAVVDHHASPSFIEGSLDVLKECLELSGLRGVLCYETTDRNGSDGMERGIAENVRFARRTAEETARRGGPGLVEAMIGGHAPFTLPDEALKALGDAVASTGRGFHTHAAEDSFDPSFIHNSRGRDVIAHLDNSGLFARPALIAHGLYLTAEDRKLLNARGAALAHNCRSNMNNSVGYNRALAELDTVALGTDGIGSDMLEETRTAYLKHRDAGGSLWPPDFARFLQNGNEVLSRCFGARFGRVEQGCRADLTVLDYVPPTPLVAENAAGHLVFGLASGSVETVIVNGSLVMEKRTFPWDTGPAFADARAQATRLWQRMDSL